MKKSKGSASKANLAHSNTANTSTNNTPASTSTANSINTASHPSVLGPNVNTLQVQSPPKGFGNKMSNIEYIDESIYD